MGRLLRGLALAGLLAALLPSGAAAEEGGARRTPRVLLTDFGPADQPSRTLVAALRAHEERRRDLREESPDDGWALAVLEAARQLDR
jgi:hypothetical protein